MEAHNPYYRAYLSLCRMREELTDTLERTPDATEAERLHAGLGEIRSRLRLLESRAAGLRESTVTESAGRPRRAVGELEQDAAG
ncbi:hypothetical protein DFQ14_11430 [Halopolyspora algeriensis]|uniref:Uncharacterized protein n=1 Tax=Halopolyspora algeriensis TaxID=1500506 RepID=A0A368VEZ1_9ACTN|nr:hypothetical protein [Halopolyspora algeriensis]RCW39769.1 hypothetical protein DFQ14_11430 [Halopolyspora algeriensis]TQM56424.1 hypothetical protein FHU43_1222 [Halopolyspora algeriensis]